MLSSFFSRYGGVSAMVGGILFIVFSFMEGADTVHVVMDALRYLALMFGSVGVYLYLRPRERFGRLGTAGYLLVLLSLISSVVLDIGILLNSAVEETWEAFGPIRILLLVTGSAIFGVAVLRSRGLPHRGAWCLILSAVIIPLTIAGMIITGDKLGEWIPWVWALPAAIMGLGWAWLGYGLWTGERPQTRQLAS